MRELLNRLLYKKKLIAPNIVIVISQQTSQVLIALINVNLIRWLPAETVRLVLNVKNSEINTD